MQWQECSTPLLQAMEHQSASKTFQPHTSNMGHNKRYPTHLVMGACPRPPNDLNQPLVTTKLHNVEMDLEAKAHWNAQHMHQQGAPIQFHGKYWRIFLVPKKVSTNLKYHLLDHMASKVAQAYWASKICSRT